ncbi:MAG TPA: ArsA family ATPase [Proteobacteria bacterium]|nr:ArsA family ATPase [Pseudomonadota bacterium]
MSATENGFKQITKIEMFTGKGGVGKTTMSVASALHYAESGPTLLISTDPSGSLSEIFSKDLDQGITRVAVNLDAVELTRELVLELWRKKFADEIYTVLSSFLPVERDIIDYIEGAPGIDEEFMLDYLLTMARSGKYQMIIWDTAPTIATLKLLFIQQMFYSHLTQAQRIYLKLKKVFNKVDPLALIDQWRTLTVDIITLLRQQTSAWVVAGAERLPIEQALDIAASLNDFGIQVNGFILNRMLSADLCQSHPFWQAKFEAQQKYRQRLFELAGQSTIKEIPELGGEMQVEGLLSEVKGRLRLSF